MLLIHLEYSPRPKAASLSSTWVGKTVEKGENCIDGIETGAICGTNKERYPFLVLEFDHPVNVTAVTIYNRDNCCWKRTADLRVIVTDKYPGVGKMADGKYVYLTDHILLSTWVMGIYLIDTIFMWFKSLSMSIEYTKF